MQLIFYKYIRVKVELFNLKEILLQAPEDTGYPWNTLKLVLEERFYLLTQ